MTPGRFEHVNVTVPDAQKTAMMLIELFGWHIRWEGPSTDGTGYTVHVGTDDAYVAVFGVGDPEEAGIAKYMQKGGLNHLGIVVEDLDAAEARVREAGYAPHAHFDYEPGRRFYFNDQDGLEIEVVSYA